MSCASSSLIVQQIVLAYEEHHLSVEDIQKDHDELSTTEIKVMLMQYSGAYRKALKQEESLEKTGKPSLLNDSEDDFTQEDLQTANAVIAETMRNADDPHLKFRAARYVREDKKGRLDALKGIAKIGVDLATFNQHMRMAFQRSGPSEPNNKVEEAKPAVVEI